VTAWGRRGDMNRSVWIMAMLVLGTLAASCGSDCQTPVPVSCCIGGCGGTTLTPAVPWLWEVEWAALRSAVPSLPSPRPDGGCPFLDPAGKRCTAYLHRPLGCRTYVCHRIRGPAHQPIEEMDRLQRRLETVARTLNPDEEGPRPLTAWYGEASS